MKPQSTSFISERTAEYVLVPNLIQNLTPHFRNVIPMFFWSTREGGNEARRTMSGVSVRLLTAFARRPKVSPRQPDRITMKVNRQLLEYSRASVEAGIPVIAGLPLISSLLHLRMDSPCLWYDIQMFATHDCDCFLALELDGSVVSVIPESVTLPEALEGPDLIHLANRSPIWSWEDAVANIRHIRNSQGDGGGFPYYSGYRPFHLVLVSEAGDESNDAGNVR